LIGTECSLYCRRIGRHFPGYKSFFAIYIFNPVIEQSKVVVYFAAIAAAVIIEIKSVNIAVLIRKVSGIRTVIQYHRAARAFVKRDFCPDNFSDLTDFSF
jgi:hypothetical protein